MVRSCVVAMVVAIYRGSGGQLPVCRLPLSSFSSLLLATMYLRKKLVVLCETLTGVNTWRISAT